MEASLGHYRTFFSNNMAPAWRQGTAKKEKREKPFKDVRDIQELVLGPLSSLCGFVLGDSHFGVLY